VNSHPLRFGITFLRQDNWDRVVEQVERYETMGLDSAWVADHFVFPWDPIGPWLEAWSLLGGLAARTRRIQLGTMVSHVIYRNPAVLERTAMTVDRMSNGRLQLGLGTGASEYDWRLTGSGEPWPFAERVDRFVEAIEIVDGLLRGTMTTYQGRYYQVQDAVLVPGPAQRPRPRLLVAAAGPRMIKLASRLADTWATECAFFREMAGKEPTASDVLRLTRERVQVLDDQARRLGRDPATIGRVVVAGFSAATRSPWASVDAWNDLVGRFRELDFNEFVFRDPEPHEVAVVEHVVATEIPRLRSAQAESL
jgi:alkanesulfonate monooxygenase SsuD/methylene tetrahydromethanopterin reductase-like flavin-dependent oxidoreductase (luciferase family)